MNKNHFFTIITTKYSAIIYYIFEFLNEFLNFQRTSFGSTTVLARPMSLLCKTKLKNSIERLRMAVVGWSTNGTTESIMNTTILVVFVLS